MNKILLVTGICILVMAGTAAAHPPSDVSLSYDPATKKITSTILHKSLNTRFHFISKVEISVNGKKVKVKKFGRQETKQAQTFSDLLANIKPGDEISIRAYCNLYGHRDASIKVTPEGEASLQ